MSKTSRRHSRYASRTIGKDPNRDATASRSADALPQLPQRAAAARPALGQEQRAARGLAELGGEHRRPAELVEHQRLDFFGGGHHQPRIRRLVGLREPHDEPVVGPHRFDVEPGFRADALDDGHGPGRVDAAAERREDADAPVAELVAAALDEHRAVVGHDAGRRHLVGEVAKQILGGLGVEIVMADQALDGRRRRHGRPACARARRPSGRAPADGPWRRPSRRASSPARPGPERRARGRG